MSRAEFEEDCPGCRPAIINLQTQLVEPDDSPLMVGINAVWAETTPDERKAFHRVTCQNSRDETDLKIIGDLNKRFGDAVEKALAS